MTPYTYLIGWPERNAFYYGARWRKGCDPSDLWVKYFTSSKVVAEKRKEWGEPTLVQIRRTFESADAAKVWEWKTLRRMKVRSSPKFLNLTEIPGPPHEKTTEQIAKIVAKLRGRKLTPEQKVNFKGSRGRTWKLSEETKRRQSDAKKGVAKPEGFGAVVSARMKGRVQSEEERSKRKASLTGKKKSPEHVRAVVEAKKRRAAERALLS
jgi:hypothetical protein